MCKQMVAAVLLIPGTFGTVTEFQIRIVCFGLSADITFMDRRFLPVFCLSPTHCFLKLLLCGPMGLRLLFCREMQYQEYNHRSQRTDDLYCGEPGSGTYNTVNKIGNIEGSQILDLDRYDKEKQHLLFRECKCKSEEDRKAYVIRREHYPVEISNIVPEPGKMQDKSPDHRADQSEKDKKIIEIIPPDPFQDRSELVIHEEHDNRKKAQGTRGRKDPGKDPPDLTLKDT